MKVMEPCSDSTCSERRIDLVTRPRLFAYLPFVASEVSPLSPISSLHRVDLDVRSCCAGLIDKIGSQVTTSAPLHTRGTVLNHSEV